VRRGFIESWRRLEAGWPEGARFVRFGCVGASGVLVDAGATHVAALAVHPDLALAIGIVVAMTWNFAWNRVFTFADADPQVVWRQYLGFCASCSVGALVSYATRYLLRRQLEIVARHIVLAVPIGVLAGMMFNYLLCRRWVFRRTDAN